MKDLAGQLEVIRSKARAIQREAPAISGSWAWSGEILAAVQNMEDTLGINRKIEEIQERAEELEDIPNGFGGPL